MVKKEKKLEEGADDLDRLDHIKKKNFKNVLDVETVIINHFNDEMKMGCVPQPLVFSKIDNYTFSLTGYNLGKHCLAISNAMVHNRN